MTSLAKAYDPQVFEKNIAEQWESSGAFRVNAHSNKPAFTISMPPPNATGQLHVGHAVMLVLEDIILLKTDQTLDKKLFDPSKTPKNPEALKYLNIFKDHPNIFNLGHGVLPETDPMTIDYIVKLVNDY